MKQAITAVVLAALTAGAAAQEVAGRIDATRDTDDFRELRTTAAYRAALGFGLKAAAVRYRAPGWGESGSVLAATYRRQDAPVQIDASLGAAQLAGHTHAVGALDSMRRLTPSTSVGLSLERDYINSVAGIEEGVTFNSLALVADHAFTARFNVGLAAGTTDFSNDNERPFVRTRWNFELAPSHGLNAYLKTRSYRNSEPNRPQYFSPERLNEASVGLSVRFLAAPRVVLGVAADAGTQHTEAGSQRTWSYALRLASPHREPVQWSIGLQASNAAGVSQTTPAESYRYTSAVVQFNVPL